MSESERPIDQMTGREWAEVKVLIAAGNLEVARKLSTVIAVLSGALTFVIFPNWWGLAFPAAVIALHFYLKPFDVALKKAQDYAEKSDFRW